MAQGAKPTSSRVITIDGITLHLAQPMSMGQEWIGNREILKQLLACWLVIDERDLPLSPRITGQPGIGKTTLAMAGARERKQDLYVFQCTADTRPEDLLITPVLAESGTISYHASPLITAVLTGSICVLDEGNRMNEKSWASLAPLLDHRRCVESIIAGILIKAHADFRCCVTMNEDASTYEVPDYILSRLQPTLGMGFPAREDELAILRYHLPFAPAEMLALTVEFLQEAHQLSLEYSVLAESGTISYHASPLITAVLTGSICVLDEGNRMNEKSWASLAPLLDHRRCVESIIAGILIKAHADFRCCVTMNEDASTYEVPDYILSRLQPTLGMGFPAREDELAILRYHLPFAPAEMLALTVEFLQEAHQLSLEYSVRDGIHLLQYALKRRAQDPTHPLSVDAAWRESLIKVLGEEALDLPMQSRRRKRALGDQALPQGLGDFFFGSDDPLHPGR